VTSNSAHSYPGSDATDEEIESARSAALAALLTDSARLKVVAAGPGTGKTHIFKKIVEAVDGRVLVFTFLTTLVTDLQEKLGESAEVFSFHGFAKQQLYLLSIEGVTNAVDYYPAAEILYEEDLLVTDHPGTRDDIADVLMNLREDSDLLPLVLRSGSYYNAVGHNDSVYRVLRTLQNGPQGVPAYGQILVDEYQDFSRLEVELIRCLAQVSPTLIVGDDDQALYGFRHASPQFIRSLIAGDEYKNFDLPYCSRCTSVLVKATHRVVAAAQAVGLLAERIPKPYLCYTPGKRADDARYPKVTHVRCSVDSSRSQYMARYVKGKIENLDADEIAESRAEGYPTVLIIGQKHFTRRIRDGLSEAGYDVSAKVRPRLVVRPLDGYRRIARHESSRLGWRILLHHHQPDGWATWVARALIDGVELVAQLDPAYRDRQLGLAALIGKVKDGIDLSNEEQAVVESATALSLEELREQLGATEPSEEPAELEIASESQEGPSILVTTLVGSKGLQAQHVFVVGVNEGSFPDDNANIAEQEVCELLVALTRARKSCTLVSCGNYSGEWLRASAFISWLRPLIDELQVDRHFFDVERR
jgi:AAA domain/UvrD-like helicase C-terminal domain